MPQPRNTVRSFTTFSVPATLTGSSPTPLLLFFLPHHLHPFLQLTLKSSYRSSSRSLTKLGSEILGRIRSLISCEKGILAWGSHAQ